MQIYGLSHKRIPFKWWMTTAVKEERQVSDLVFLFLFFRMKTTERLRSFWPAQLWWTGAEQWNAMKLLNNDDPVSAWKGDPTFGIEFASPQDTIKKLRETTNGGLLSRRRERKPVSSPFLV